MTTIPQLCKANNTRVYFIDPADGTIGVNRWNRQISWYRLAAGLDDPEELEVYTLIGVTDGPVAGQIMKKLADDEYEAAVVVKVERRADISRIN